MQGVGRANALYVFTRGRKSRMNEDKGTCVRNLDSRTAGCHTCKLESLGYNTHRDNSFDNSCVLLLLLVIRDSKKDL